MSARNLLESVGTSTSDRGIPVLRGADVRRILAYCGFTLTDYSKWLGRWRGYAAQSIAPRGRLALKHSESLIAFVGADLFWKAADDLKMTFSYGTKQSGKTGATGATGATGTTDTTHATTEA